MKRILLLSLIGLVCSLNAKNLIDFSNKKIPKYIKALKSKVQITNIRSIHGENSLRWEWNKKSTLTFNTVIPFMTNEEATKFVKRRALGIFSFWVYNTKALPNNISN